MKPLFDFEGHRNKIAKKFWDMNAEGASLEERKKMLDEAKGTLEFHVAEKLRDPKWKEVGVRRSFEKLPGFENFEAIDISDKIPDKLKLRIDFSKTKNPYSTGDEWGESLDFGGMEVLRNLFEQILPGEVDNPHNVFHTIGYERPERAGKKFINHPIASSRINDAEFCMHVATSNRSLYWYGPSKMLCILSPDSENFKEYADTTLYYEPNNSTELHKRTVAALESHFDIKWEDLSKEEMDSYYGKFIKENPIFSEVRNFFTKEYIPEELNSKHSDRQKSAEILVRNLKGQEDILFVPPRPENSDRGMFELPFEWSGSAYFTLYALSKGWPVSQNGAEILLPLPKENTSSYNEYQKPNPEAFRFTDISKYMVDLSNGILYRYKNPEVQNNILDLESFIQNQNNFSLFFLGDKFISSAYKEKGVYKKFEAKYPDMAKSLNEKIGRADRSRSVLEGLKPFIEDLYGAYKTMRALGASDEDLFS